MSNDNTTYPRTYSNDLSSAPSPLVSLIAWPLEGQPARSPWRLVAAAGAIAEAISHLPLLTGSLSGTPYIGVGFVLLTVAGFMLALLLVISDTPSVWALATIVAASAIIGYVLSRTTGLPEFNNQIGNWTSPLGIISIIGELMMLIPGLIQLSRRRS